MPKTAQVPASGASTSSRRKFLSLSALLATATVLRAQAKKVEGGLAPILPKKAPVPSTAIKPAGSGSTRNFSKHCTACQLCVNACPNQVLRPSKTRGSMMQPEMAFDRGYCRPECTKCSEVCPTGAIHRITAAEKSAIQIGHAVLEPELCIVNRDKVHCGNCSRHCPSGAIHMVPKDPKAIQTPPNPFAPAPLMVPTIDTEHCIGCGACEFLCPSRPRSAIHVEGHERHRIV